MRFPKTWGDISTRLVNDADICSYCRQLAADSSFIKPITLRTAIANLRNTKNNLGQRIATSTNSFNLNDISGSYDEVSVSISGLIRQKIKFEEPLIPVANLPEANLNRDTAVDIITGVARVLTQELIPVFDAVSPICDLDLTYPAASDPNRDPQIYNILNLANDICYEPDINSDYDIDRAVCKMISLANKIYKK